MHIRSNTVFIILKYLVDISSEVTWFTEKQTGSHKRWPGCIKGRKHYNCIQNVFRILSFDFFTKITGSFIAFSVVCSLSPSHNKNAI